MKQFEKSVVISSTKLEDKNDNDLKRALKFKFGPGVDPSLPNITPEEFKKMLESASEFNLGLNEQLSKDTQMKEKIDNTLKSLSGKTENEPQNRNVINLADVIQESRQAAKINNQNEAQTNKEEQQEKFDMEFLNFVKSKLQGKRYYYAYNVKVSNLEFKIEFRTLSSLEVTLCKEAVYDLLKKIDYAYFDNNEKINAIINNFLFEARLLFSLSKIFTNIDSQLFEIEPYLDNVVEKLNKKEMFEKALDIINEIKSVIFTYSSLKDSSILNLAKKAFTKFLQKVNKYEEEFASDDFFINQD